MNVAVFQFVKERQMEGGESRRSPTRAAARTEQASAARCSGTRWAQAGHWSAKPTGRRRPRRGGRRGWAEIARRLAAAARFLRLDRFTYPLKWGWISTTWWARCAAVRAASMSSSPAAMRRSGCWIDAADLGDRMTKVATDGQRAARASAASNGERPPAVVIDRTLIIGLGRARPPWQRVLMGCAAPRVTAPRRSGQAGLHRSGLPRWRRAPDGRNLDPVRWCRC